jgi:hypothetical protein
MRNIKDHIAIGIIVGLIGPLMGALGFYMFEFRNTELLEFLDLAISKKLLSPLLSLCAVINLGLFYLFLNYDKLYTARGIILSTLIYGLIIVLFKFAQ